MGIDLEPYRNPSQAHQEKARVLRQHYPGPLWLACGRLVYYKGLTTAVRALSFTPGTLLVVGEGPEQPALEAEARRFGVRNRIFFIGSLPYLDVIPFYLAADAFWFPSNARSEAFGLVQVEAMACGCPVINTALFGSGVPWVSPHEITGLTVRLTIPRRWRARHTVCSASRASRQTGRGRPLVPSREFDHTAMAERSLALYHGLLAGRPVSPVYEAAQCAIA